MTESELRTILFRTVDDFGPVDGLAMLLQAIDEDEDMRLAAAKYGHLIVTAIREARTATVHSFCHRWPIFGPIFFEIV